MSESFESMLSGGHPNSLGRTLEVVDAVLQDPETLARLLACYSSADAVVRLRTSNALKRLTRQHPEWLAPYIDRLVNDISTIDQASTQWTLASLFGLLETRMTPAQKRKARAIMQHNLQNHDDWIVLNTTMDTLAAWAAEDKRLTAWLEPQLQRLSQDRRKSVARKAGRLLTGLTGT